MSEPDARDERLNRVLVEAWFEKADLDPAHLVRCIAESRVWLDASWGPEEAWIQFEIPFLGAQGGRPVVGDEDLTATLARLADNLAADVEYERRRFGHFPWDRGRRES